MNDINSIRLTALNRFVASMYSPPKVAEPIKAEVGTKDCSFVSSTHLEAIVGQALASLQQVYDEPLENAEATLIIRLKALYLFNILKAENKNNVTLGDVINLNLSSSELINPVYLSSEVVKDAYIALFKIEYNILRRPSSPYVVSEDPNTFPESNLPGIEVDNKEDDSFIHHSCESGFGPSLDKRSLVDMLVYSQNRQTRYSLNVNVTRELVAELDKFILEENGIFKFSKHPGNRHDSITCYFADRLSAEKEIELAKLIQPYIRGDNLLGDEIKDRDEVLSGIKREVSPGKQAVHSLTGECFDLDPTILEALDLKHGETVNMSTGQYLAITNMLMKLKQDLPGDVFLLE